MDFNTIKDWPQGYICWSCGQWVQSGTNNHKCNKYNTPQTWVTCPNCGVMYILGMFHSCVYAFPTVITLGAEDKLREALLKIATSNEWKASRYDTDNEHVLHLWREIGPNSEGESVDIRVPKK